jgi:hypothetical protein
MMTVQIDQRPLVLDLTLRLGHAIEQQLRVVDRRGTAVQSLASSVKFIIGLAQFLSKRGGQRARYRDGYCDEKLGES